MLRGRLGAAQVVVHRLEPISLAQPFWRYAEAVKNQPHAFLLDSARGPQSLGRFSFLGADPELLLTAKRRPGAGPDEGAWLEVSRFSAGAEPSVERSIGDPFALIRRELEARQVPESAWSRGPIPFHGGAVGYFGYECKHFIERLPDRGRDDLALPDLALLFVDAVVAHDHATGRSMISAVGRGASEAEAEACAERAVMRWRERLHRFDANPPVVSPGFGAPRAALEPRPALDCEAYRAMVEEARERILAGDAFEICTTNRFEVPLRGEAWDLYAELRRINPAPFAAFLQLPFARVISSSPERFLRLDKDRVVETRPIKGTRPRHADPDEDRRLVDELVSSEKDRAENVMIVDLARNDLGRVCRIGSVSVPALFEVESYATVHQLVSTVRGVLAEGRDAIDLIRACFPGGSMTGAPKVEAMKIIDRLEPKERGIYSGALGYLGLDGTLDLSIVIRTLVVTEGRAFFGAGGAVVADSNAATEHEEMELKARALIEALENVERARR